MPLALQALLPLIALGLSATAVRLRPGRRWNGLVAAAGTGTAAAITLVELVNLAPAERVDIPLLMTFPFADLSIHLDALSLGFAVMILVTGFLSMLARYMDPRGDRRDPWLGWILTTAAALVVVLAGNLLLLYAALQLLTLAWSGALDETAPRGRGIRILQQVGDLGLLVVAGLVIQSEGTSAFSGLPSDALNGLSLLVALLPAATRLAGLAVRRDPPGAVVFFEPAVAWAAPSGYLLLRMLSLVGGLPPTKWLQFFLYATGVALAAVSCWWAWRERTTGRLAARLLLVQAGVAVAFTAFSNPLAMVASSAGWLLLIPLTGLRAAMPRRASLGHATMLVGLALLPPSAAFTGVWLGIQAVGQSQLGLASLPLWVVVLASAVVVGSQLALRIDRRWDLPAVWGVSLLVLGAIPWPFLEWVVVPVAHAVRAIPAGVAAATWAGMDVGTASWPSLLASASLLTLLGLLLLRGGAWFPLRTRAAATASPRQSRWTIALAARPAWTAKIPWVRLCWVACAAVSVTAVLLR